MLPDVALLKRHPYFALQSLAAFDPTTLFIRSGQKGGFLVAPGLSGADGELDQATADEASALHEDYHWFQHMGTTTGALLALLRHSQQCMSFMYFDQVKPGDRARQIESRAGVGERPLIPIDEHGRLLPVDATLASSAELDAFAQVWYQHLLVLTMLDNPTLLDYLQYPRGKVFGYATACAMMNGCSLRGEASPDFDEMCKWYEFDEGEIIQIAFQSERLTTRALFEGGATTNELLLLLLRGASNEMVTDLSHRLASGMYGVAMTTFLSKLAPRPKRSDLVRTLQTFLVVCDVALNPPVPPLCSKPYDGNDHWRWSDVYPPQRFVRLIDAVSAVGLIEQNSPHERLRGYIDELCQEVGWPNPDTYVHPFPACEDVIDFEKAGQGIRLETLQSYSYYDYLFWVQHKMWELRATNLPMLIYPAACHCEPELWDYYKALSRSIVMTHDSVWARPPLIWKPDGSWGYATANETFNQWLLTNSAAHYFMYDLMAGAGRFDSRAYPPVLRRQNVFDHVRESIEATLGAHLGRGILGREPA